jgi:hypothetical protein
VELSTCLEGSHALSKPLPDGRNLKFEADRSGYLRIVSLPERRTLGSDDFATTHADALPTLARALNDFSHGHLCAFCAIGGYTVFPNGLAQQLPVRVNSGVRRWTVNQARGMDRRIADRFDLTFEAIRLFYAGIVDLARNPLGDVLEAYG